MVSTVSVGLMQMPRQKLFLEDAQIARDKITREEMQRIEKLYEDWAKQIGKRANKFNCLVTSFKNDITAN